MNQKKIKDFEVTTATGTAAVNHNAESLESLATPLVNFLRQNYNPHTRIVISFDHLKIEMDELNVPVSNSFGGNA